MNYIKLIGTFLFLICFNPSIAQESAVYTENGKAIKGYDPVAFFTESKPIMGKDSLTYHWQDATWLFSSEENRELFEKNPEKYAPQYGGYCAYGVAQGHKAPTSIETWTIVHDKLYLNYNKEVNKAWVKDQQNLIDKADEEWPRVKQE